MPNKKIMMLAILLVSLFAISTVSAMDNVTGDVVSVEEQNDAEISVKEADSEVVSAENVSIENDSDEVLAANDKNVSSDDCDKDVLSASEENIALSSSNEYTIAVSPESSLSVSNGGSVLSVPLNREDSKLTSIYDKVYSTKVWKTVKIGTLKLKYSWSKKKMNKVAKKKTKSIIKKLKKVKRKYTKKGWIYNRVFYNYNYGKKSAVFKYYVQFYKTVYYDGYGNVL